MNRDPAKLPAHVIRERARWVRLVEGRTDLTHGAKRYARALAYRRWGAGQVAWARRAAARTLGCAVRSIVRWNDELCRAGLMHRAQRGGIWAGRRMLNVFGLLYPQVRKGDRLNPPTTRPTAYRRRRATLGQQLFLEIALPDRTTARQPRPRPAPDHPLASAAAGYGTRTTTPAL